MRPMFGLETSAGTSASHATGLARHGYLLITLPGMLVLSVAVLLFESSSHATGDFTSVIRSLMEPPHEVAVGQILAEARPRRACSIKWCLVHVHEPAGVRSF